MRRAITTDQMKRDEILAVYAAGPEAVVALVEQLLAAHGAEVAQLRARLERLEAQLNRDGHNSHKPPSSGGQVGHPGTTLTQVAQPDRVVPHRASLCPHCQADLADAPVVGCERRQVV